MLKGKHLSILVTSVAVLLIAAIVLWFSRGRDEKKSPSQIKTPRSNLVLEEKPAQLELPQTITAPIDPSLPRNIKAKEWNRRRRVDPKWEWKMPINFYGKVVDENNNPITGATIDFGWTDLSDDGHSEKTVFSNNHGLFSLVGEKGKHLTVLVKKDGYHTSREQNRFTFEYAADFAENFHQSDPDQPVIFRLRKKGEPAELVAKYSKVPLPKDGTPVRFNFLKGKPSGDGQFEVQAWKSNERDSFNRFDWRLVMSVPGGGLKEHSVEFPFLAPESGYQKSVEFIFTKDMGENWKNSVEKTFFIAIGNPPQYGRLRFKANGTGQNFYMDYWINPTGSRNLEYNPAESPSK